MVKEVVTERKTITVTKDEIKKKFNLDNVDDFKMTDTELVVLGRRGKNDVRISLTPRDFERWFGIGNIDSIDDIQWLLFPRSEYAVQFTKKLKEAVSG
jgi:hypothetical protein